MAQKQENLEEKADKYYEFQPDDFIPLTGFSHYNRRAMNGYLDDCQKAGRVIAPAFFQTFPRRALLVTYNLAFVMGSAKIVTWLYDKL